MLVGWEALYGLVSENAWAAAVLLLAFFGAALNAYVRDQVRAGTIWALTPIARHLPWNRPADDSRTPPSLSSEFTLVQLFLIDPAGKRARYEKTSSFIVTHPTISYQEGVTAENTARAFATMRGTIVRTVVERGYYVSEIRLGNQMGEGERFTNVYCADVHNSFRTAREHWTQEFTYPTKHVSLQVHFPKTRPPQSVACKVIDGALEKPARSAAQLTSLFGCQSIVWDVANPRLHEALKLEWTW